MSDMISTTIGNYRIISELGNGMLGKAYLAEEILMGFKVVLRETSVAIQPENEEHQIVIDRLKSLASIKHALISSLRRAFVHANRLYLVTDYTAGKTLSLVLTEDGAFAEERALRISRQITDTLMYVHREGFFHGRLKASKICLSDTDVVSVRDFGIIEILGRYIYPQAEQESRDQTHTHIKVGGIKRMSGAELDIYACGLLLYQMLTAQLAFCRELELYQLFIEDQSPPEFKIPSEAPLSPKAQELISIMSTVTKPQCKLMTAKEIMLRHSEQESSNAGISAHNHKPDLIPIELIRVEGGVFEMGDHFNEGENDERPRHLVKLYPFYIAKYQLTQKAWLEVMGNNPSYHRGDDLPVESVSWLDAVAYCNQRSVMEGLVPCFSLDGNPEPKDWSRGTVYCRFAANGYRLPTEAEWEYAARGGKGSSGYRYAGSNNEMEVAWCKDNSGMKLQPIGGKKPNELGIHDMSGNVWEWCWDWFDAKFYTPKPILNPTGPDQGGNKVLRGGSFSYHAGFMRVSCRHHFGANLRYDGNGIRLVRSYLQSQKST
ncbi:MAG: SUMF1/EgtB/PvdO family nonheme iron enzyme [Candidatus Cloacimonetes bacterium]|nr:SUMF1/EgtB/PvdO family nonheme iron enzyme [Candidatus Cloacimonadota bacterium]